MVTIKALPMAIGAAGYSNLPDRMAAYRLNAEWKPRSGEFPLVLASDAFAGTPGIVELSATDIKGFRLSDQCPWTGIHWKSDEAGWVGEYSSSLPGTERLVLLLDELARGRVSVEDFEIRIGLDPGEGGTEEGSDGTQDGGALEHIRAGSGTNDGGAMDTKTILGRGKGRGGSGTDDGGPMKPAAVHRGNDRS